MTTMFNTLDNNNKIVTKTNQFCCNKLLLLCLIIYISPFSHELEQQPSQMATPPSPEDFMIVKRDFELSFESFTCLLNDNWVADKKLKSSSLASDRMQNMEKLSCSLTKNSKRRYLQMEMSFKRQINQFIFNILIVLQRPRYLMQPQFVLLNLTSLNGCDILAAKSQVTLLHWVRSALQHYSNFPRKCPFQAHNLYYIRNFKWDMEQMPSFYVEAPILVEFSYVFDNATKVRGIIEAKLELKSNKKFAVS